MYWIVLPERSHETELSIDALPPALDRLDVSLDEGSAITTTLPPIEVPYSQHPEERITDCIVAPTRLGLLMNDAVRGAFDSLEVDNVQYFPARLRERSSGAVREDYWIANVVGRVACVDRDRSELVTFDDGEIQFIDSLVLDLDDGADHGHVFRPAEFPSVLVISDDLKRSLEREYVTRLGIYRPAEFSL